MRIWKKVSISRIRSGWMLLVSSSTGWKQHVTQRIQNASQFIQSRTTHITHTLLLKICQTKKTPQGYWTHLNTRNNHFHNIYRVVNHDQFGLRYLCTDSLTSGGPLKLYAYNIGWIMIRLCVRSSTNSICLKTTAQHKTFTLPLTSSSCTQHHHRNQEIPNKYSGVNNIGL